MLVSYHPQCPTDLVQGWRWEVEGIFIYELDWFYNGFTPPDTLLLKRTLYTYTNADC